MNAASSRPAGVALLLEVIVGLGIFAGSLLLIMGIFVMSHRATTSTKNLSVASSLAREFIEGEIAKGYSGATTQSAVDIPVPATINGVETATTFAVKVDVFPEAAGAKPNNFVRKRLLVTVSWREGGDRKTSLETYLVD